MSCKDLAYVVEAGDAVEPVAIDSDDGLAILRHSTAHVMAQAVQQLYPDAKLGIGPPIENGFYYDFDVETPFTPDDLGRIDKEMQRIVKEGQTFSRRVVSDDEARTELADEPYKLELIGLKGPGAASAADGADAEVGGGELTIYDNHRRDGELAWKDLCRGPHLPSTRHIPAFKLMRSRRRLLARQREEQAAAAALRHRLGVADALKAYLARLAEAEKRDHRKLGAELDLYSFPDEIGSGMAVFHPKGGVIKRVMEDYVRRRHEEEGFQFVGTPHISKEGLFHTSGHLPYYADGMFPPMEMEGGALLPQGHELPDAQPDLPVARAVLPRAAAAALRVRRGLPVREVRRRARPHPGARPDHGRLALLRHRRAGVRRDQAPAGLRAWGCSRTSGSTTSTSSCRPATPTRTSSSAPTSSGRSPPRSSRTRPPRPGSSSSPTRAARRTTARRSRCRRGTRSAAPGRCRRCSTTSTSRRASSWSTRPPTARASSR